MAIFISDLHLGNKHSQAGRFYTWLECQDLSETLYLVGDIIDDHQMKEWPQAHVNALTCILSFNDIRYCPGNHDKFFRRFGQMYFGNSCIADELYYQASDKKHYLVLHGDQQDWMMKAAFISPRFLGHNIRHWMGKLHGVFNGSPKAIVKYAKEKGFNGVICGHTHEPEISFIDGIEYINCGDFVTSCTAVVERGKGFELIKV